MIPQFYTWQSRIKIGQVTNPKVWKQSVFLTTKKWLISTPTAKLTDNSRLIIIDMIKGNYKRNTIQSWQKAALFLGLQQEALINEDFETTKYLMDFVESQMDSKGSWKEKPAEVDGVILAYAILKLEGLDCTKYKPAFDYCYHLILDLKGSDGTIAYRKHLSNYRFVDTIGFISPFLVRYGLVFGNSEAIDLGINQILEFNKFGMLEKEFIPCHTYNSTTNLPVGLFGWGRGLGWYAIGLIDSWNELPNDHPQKNSLTHVVIQFAKMAMKFQNENGSWSWLVLNVQAQADSSTTATLAWFLSNVDTIPEIALEAKNTVAKALIYLQSVTRRNGAIDFSQGDTKGIGVYSQEFDILPFTQGFALRTIYIKQ